MVEHGRLGCPGRAGVVMAGDRVEELRRASAARPARALLDETQAEVDVAEQTALVGLAEGRALRQLARPPDVVEERRCEQEVEAQTRDGAATSRGDRRHADRMLEQSAGVRVMALCGRKPTQRRAQVRVPTNRPTMALSPGCADLAREELEEAVELVGIPPQRGCERHRVGIRRGLECADVDLEAVAELLYASEDADRVTLVEARVQQLDVVPDAGARFVRSGPRARARGMPRLPAFADARFRATA